MDNLTQVAGDLYLQGMISQSVSLPNLQTISGSLRIGGNSDLILFNLNALTSVTSVFIIQNDNLVNVSFPMLHSAVIYFHVLSSSQVKRVEAFFSSATSIDIEVLRLRLARVVFPRLMLDSHFVVACCSGNSSGDSVLPKSYISGPLPTLLSYLYSSLVSISVTNCLVIAPISIPLPARTPIFKGHSLLRYCFLAMLLIYSLCFVFFFISVASILVFRHLYPIWMHFLICTLYLGQD